MDEAPWVSTPLIELCLLIIGGGFTIGFIFSALRGIGWGNR